MAEVCLRSNYDSLQELLFVSPGLVPVKDLFIDGKGICGNAYDDTAYIPRPEWRAATAMEYKELCSESDVVLYHRVLPEDLQRELFSLSSPSPDTRLSSKLMSEMLFTRVHASSSKHARMTMETVSTYGADGGRYTTTSVYGEYLGLHVDGIDSFRAMWNRGKGTRAFYFLSVGEAFLKQAGFAISDLRYVTYTPVDPATLYALERRTAALAYLANCPVYILLLPPCHGWATDYPHKIIHDGCTLLIDQSQKDEVLQVIQQRF
jgi:hypothetical protein